MPPAEALGTTAAAAVDPSSWPLVADVQTVDTIEPPLLVVRVSRVKAERYLRARVEAVRAAGAAAAAAAGSASPPMAWADAAAVVADVVGGVWGDQLRGRGGMTPAERRAYDDLVGDAVVGGGGGGGGGADAQGKGVDVAPPLPAGPPMGAASKAAAAAAKARVPPKRSAAAAALERVDRTGMRSMRSYFAKKA
ncbi:hypothetical protein MMPV_000124 [Pyropia vietnamensis]